MTMGVDIQKNKEHNWNMAKHTNRFGQDMSLIQKIARPIWDKFLFDFQISEAEANQNDWDFNVFTEEIALELRAADKMN